MKNTFSRAAGRAAFGALAAICLTFGTNVRACSLPGGMGPRPAVLADPALRIEAPHLEENRPRAQPGTTPASVVGLWQVTYSSNGAVADMAFEVFHSDGTEMLNDITPPAEGNVCLGVWVQLTSTTYRLTHPSWVFDAGGNLIGTAAFDVTITIGSADTFTGVYILTYFDTHGTKGSLFTGTLAATRVLPAY